MSVTVKNPDAFQWKCGRCGTWNKMEHGTCSQCGAMAHQFASAYRLHNELTVKEQNFYDGTAPNMLMELRELKQAVLTLIDVIEEGRS